MDLERNLIDNVLECGEKLGKSTLPVTFYYHETSLMELLDCKAEELSDQILAFYEKEQKRLGKVNITELAKEPGRYGITVPKEGMQWVFEHYEASAFTKAFIGEISKKQNTLEGLLTFFQSYPEEVEVIRHDREWAVYFKEGRTDPYVYHLEENAFGVEYHRFTRAAYDLLMNA